MTLHGSPRSPKAEACHCLASDDCPQILESTTTATTTTTSTALTSNQNSETDTVLHHKSAHFDISTVDDECMKLVFRTSPQIRKCSSKLYSQLFDEITGDLESIKNNFSANEMQVLEAFNMQHQIHNTLDQLSKQNHKLEEALNEANIQKAALVNDLRNKNLMIDETIDILEQKLLQMHVGPDNRIRIKGPSAEFDQQNPLQVLISQYINKWMQYQNIKSLETDEASCSLAEKSCLDRQKSQNKTLMQCVMGSVDSKPCQRPARQTFMNIVPFLDKSCDNSLCRKGFKLLLQRADHLQSELCSIQKNNSQTISQISDEFRYQYEKDQQRYETLSKDYDTLKRQLAMQQQNNKVLNAKLIEAIEKCCGVEKKYCRLMSVHEGSKRTIDELSKRNQSLVKDLQVNTSKLTSAFQMIEMVEEQKGKMEKVVAEKSSEKSMAEAELRVFKEEYEGLKRKMAKAELHEKGLQRKLDYQTHQISELQTNTKLVEEKWKQMYNDLQRTLESRAIHLTMLSEQNKQLEVENKKHGEFVTEVKGLLDNYRSWKIAQVAADRKNQEKMDKLQEGIRTLIEDRQNFVDLFYDLHRDFEIVKAELVKYRAKSDEEHDFGTSIPLEAFMDRISLIHKTLFRIMEAKETQLPTCQLVINSVNFNDSLVPTEPPSLTEAIPVPTAGQKQSIPDSEKETQK